MRSYAMLLLIFICSTTKIWWAFLPACSLNRSWNLSTTWSHSMLPSRMETCQRFHSLHSWQPQCPNFECFKGSLKDARSKQESFGSKICVNFAVPALSTFSDMLTTDLYFVASICRQTVYAGVSCSFFYRHPVELEDVTNGEFLGTSLDADLRKLSFQQPAASCQFRPFRSQALKHTSYQLLLPEFVWPAATPFRIIKPDLMYSSWSDHTWSRLPSYEAQTAS